MTDSKLLDIAEDIKNLSTSGNKIQVEEYKNGKKVKKSPGPVGRGMGKKKKLPIIVIDTAPKSIKSYEVILTNPLKKKDYPKIGKDY